MFVLRPKHIAAGIGALILLALAANSVAIVSAGERGVLLTWGKVDGLPLGEGLHFKAPIAQNIVNLDVKTQKYEVNAEGASKDLQIVHTTVALNYHIDPSQTSRIYQDIGIGFENKVIAPAIQEAVKASTAQYTAEELITKREIVKILIDEEIKKRLVVYDILVETVSITNFEFSEQFNQAIESKVTAEQQALKASNDLQRIRIEAQQQIEKAKGEAEAIKIVNEELLKSPKYLEFIATQKWDGHLPLYMGSGATPFVQIPTASGI